MQEKMPHANPKRISLRWPDESHGITAVSSCFSLQIFLGRAVRQLFELATIKTRFMVLLLSFFILSQTSHAQQCQTADGKVKSGTLGYKERGGRCEGLLTDWKVSGPDINLFSFTLGKPDYFYAADEEIIIQQSTGTDQLQVRGQSFDMSDLYRLDFSLEKNGKKLIPAAEVLFPAIIKPEKFGIYGYSQFGKDKFFSPVKMSTKRYDFKLHKPTSYFLKFTTNMKMTGMSWSLLPILNNAYGKPGAKNPVPSANIYANYVVVEIPKEMITAKTAIQVWFDNDRRREIYNLQP